MSDHDKQAVGGSGERLARWYIAAIAAVVIADMVLEVVLAAIS